MARKPTDPHSLTPRVWGNLKIGAGVGLPKAVCKDVEVMRWLYHWVGDTMADRGYTDLLVIDVQARLASLTLDIVSDYVTELMKEAMAATKQSGQPQTSKETAKPVAE